MTQNAGHAAQLPSSPTKFRYTVIDDRIGDAIRQFGRDVHLRIIVSDEVVGRVTDRLSVTGIRQFFDDISVDYNLNWYYDGYAVFLTAASENVSDTFTVSERRYPILMQALINAGITDERFPVRLLPSTWKIIVTGPPRFVQLVEQTASATADLGGAALGPSLDEATTVYRGSERQRVDFSR